MSEDFTTAVLVFLTIFLATSWYTIFFINMFRKYRDENQENDHD